MRRSRERAWQMAMAVVALAATVMALYLQIFGLRARQEEARIAAARLDDALAESRTRLKAEILAELRADLTRRSAGRQPGAEPLPDTVLRRLDDDTSLGQVADSRRPGETRPGGSVRSLAEEMAESDRVLRRNVEELRGETRRELAALRRVNGLILVALVPLVLHLLYAFWRDRETVEPAVPGEATPGESGGGFGRR